MNVSITEIIHAVVLDLDGVMVDSETIAIAMWREFLALFGKALSDAEYRQMVGMEPKETAIFVRQRTGISVGVEEIVEVVIWPLGIATDSFKRRVDYSRISSEDTKRSL